MPSYCTRLLPPVRLLIHVDTVEQGCGFRVVPGSVDEVRREIDVLTACRAATTDLAGRVDIITALQMAGRRLVALEEQQSADNWERRG
jgi:hypothetical protein